MLAHDASAVYNAEDITAPKKRWKLRRARAHVGGAFDATRSVTGSGAARAKYVRAGRKARTRVDGGEVRRRSAHREPREARVEPSMSMNKNVTVAFRMARVGRRTTRTSADIAININALLSKPHPKILRPQQFLPAVI